MEPLSHLPYDPGQFRYLLPVALPALFGLLTLCMDLFIGPRQSKTPLALTAVVGSLMSGLAAMAVWAGDVDQIVLAGSLAVSRYSAALAVAVVMAVSLVALAAVHNGRRQDGSSAVTLASGEFYALIQFAACGMLALVAANDLVTLFVAIEIISISSYCLTGLDRRRPRSAEGAVKYFVLGAFASGFLLYGIALVYGATHTLQLDLIAATPLAKTAALPLARVGAALFLVGLLFKVGAVPFHSWAPDAYEGAPTAVTGFMSVAVKAAAFGAAARVLVALGAAGALGVGGLAALWLVAGLTVIVGNAGALTQRNPRRLLAYSSIAHTGYLLVGLVALVRAVEPGAADEIALAGKDAVRGMLFYLIGYGLANLGAFAVLCHLERGGEEVEDVADLAGLSRTQPSVALAMTVCMISLAGIPGTAGFIGKLWVFRAAVGAGEVGLVVLALVTSVLSLYYYLRVIVAMYMQEPGQGLPGDPVAPARPLLLPDPRRWASRLALGSAALLTVLLGLYPGSRLMQLVIDGAEALL